MALAKLAGAASIEGGTGRGSQGTVPRLIARSSAQVRLILRYPLRMPAGPYFAPVVELESDRGSRTPHFPCSTEAKKRSSSSILTGGPASSVPGVHSQQQFRLAVPRPRPAI